jgi:hypothetical protein
VGDSVLILSHHSVKLTKIRGLPNLALLFSRSAATIPPHDATVAKGIYLNFIGQHFQYYGQPTDVMIFSVPSRNRLLFGRLVAQGEDLNPFLHDLNDLIRYYRKQYRAMHENDPVMENMSCPLRLHLKSFVLT